jgi:hypothetical protein
MNRQLRLYLAVSLSWLLGCAAWAWVHWPMWPSAVDELERTATAPPVVLGAVWLLLRWGWRR